MKQALGLRILSEIMRWQEERVRREFAWLQLMSRMKYDGYRDFVAGARFIESLAAWLQQFHPSEREAAYALIRNHLVYVGPAEIQHIIETFYPEHVQRRLMQAMAERLGIKRYRIWSDPSAAKQYKILLRKCLFFGLSDGARIDTFRRANERIISNEQVSLVTEISDDKWSQLLKDLREELQDETARFAFVFLLDDFAGTGKTLLRKEEEWKGRLVRFWKAANRFLDSHFDPGWTLSVHHYMATVEATQGIEARNREIAQSNGITTWFGRVEFSYGLILPEQVRVNEDRCREFMPLVDKYYDSSIETKHTAKGGGPVKLGFGKCALPLVLEHNTPNNSIALLWADTDGGKDQHPMRPLFRRRQRHS